MLLACNPGQFSFILCAASDTLPTAVNLQHWHIQCSAKCTLCGSGQPTTVHVLGGCPGASSQGRFTYCRNKVLHCLATELSKCFTGSSVTSFYYADLRQATVPSQQFLIPYLLQHIGLIYYFQQE